MRIALPDVNVLIAYLDLAHVHHEAAVNWFDAHFPDTWATCPLTENAVLRILGKQYYREALEGVGSVTAKLMALTELRGHVFWPDGISLVGLQGLRAERIQGANQITDVYLLALARHHDGELVTFDKRLVTSALEHGDKHLKLLDPF